MRAAPFGLIVIFATPGPLGAQGYRPSIDTLRYRSENSYLMYFVQGPDTLGQPIVTETLETMHIQAAAAGLRAWVQLSGGGDNPFRSEQTYTLAPNGRVVLVAGQPTSAHANARVDLLPRLPDDETPLSVGSTWVDTVSTSNSLSYGATYYEVKRTYRVETAIDTAGATVLLAIAQGQMRLRQGGWQDSTAGTVWWQEVSGSIIDSVWFDPALGRLVLSASTMDLVGRGGAGPRGAGVTMPSGLRSAVRRSLLRPK